MAKTRYPTGTTLPPLQALIFVFGNNMQVHSTLKPQPDHAGEQVAHVALEVIMAGDHQVSEFGNPGEIWSSEKVAAHAYKLAQSEANRVKSEVVEIRLEGEEFLEKSDVEHLVGNTIPVTVY